MSRVYEALRQVEREVGRIEGSPVSPAAGGTEIVHDHPQAIPTAGVVTFKPSISTRMVALLEPKSLGAEKFRALATRLENLRHQKFMRSIQVTSSVINEGKTLVSTNLAITLASQTRARVLLLEGDLHRPNLSALLGLGKLEGLDKWWSAPNTAIVDCLYKSDAMPLWFLSAGAPHDSPIQVLQSSRFAEAFSKLNSLFDWIVVDSTPMLPVNDANVWSRIVDGTLIVVREGLASIDTLKKGVESLDNLKLIGTVLNATSEFERASYANQYYGYHSRARSVRLG